MVGEELHRLQDDGYPHDGPAYGDVWLQRRAALVPLGDATPGIATACQNLHDHAVGTEVLNETEYCAYVEYLRVCLRTWQKPHMESCRAYDESIRRLVEATLAETKRF